MRNVGVQMLELRTELKGEGRGEAQGYCTSVLHVCDCRGGVSVGHVF